MPLIMEDSSFVDKFDEMDDLFLDHQPTILPTPPLARDTLKRTDELAISGCCQKLAWSKSGALAHIARNGHAVAIQAFAQKNGKREFALTKPALLDTSNIHEDHEIVHVCWNSIGHELAIIDLAGRISIFQSVFGILNCMLCIGRYIPEKPSAETSVIGVGWLSASRPTGPQFQAKRVNNKWVYAPSPQATTGPTHPTPNKNALFLVTRSGTLRLMFATLQPTPDNSYDQSSVVLHHLQSGQSLLSHASFAAELRGTMLLSTCDTSQIVRTYRVDVNWNYPFNAKEVPPRTFRLEPTVEVTHLKVINLCSEVEATSSHLSHLRVLPAVSDAISGQTAPDTVMAVLNGSENALDSTPLTRVVRYELLQDTEELHSAFDQLAAKKNQKIAADAGYATMTAVRLADYELSGTVVTFTLIRNNTILALIHGDGTVVFLDRFSLQPITKETGSGILRIIAEAGFLFSSGDSCSNVAISPNGCILVSASDDETLSTRYMEYPLEDHSSSAPLPKDDLAIAALSVAFANSQAQQQTHDDILALIRRHQHNINVVGLLEGIFASVGINFDFTAPDSPQKLLNSQAVPRCLAMQHSLGNDEGLQSVSSKAAWMLMSLRQAAWSFHIGFGSIQSLEGTRLDLPGSLLGVVTWYIDVVCMLIDELFWTSREIKKKEGNVQHIQDLIATSNSATLPLLLSSIARIFFRSNSRYLRSLVTLSRQTTSTTTHRPDETYSWRTFADIVSNSPVTITRFEQFLAEIDHHVKKTYDDAGWGDAARAAAERGMLVSGCVPEVLMPVVQRLLTTALEKVVEGIEEPGRLLFGRGGQGALGLGGAAVDREDGVKGMLWDVLRKVPLFGLREVRRCTICGSMMENLVPRPGALAAWVLTLQKSCICGNPWVVVEV